MISQLIFLVYFPLTEHQYSWEADRVNHAILGKNAKVKNLILTHFSARYKDEVGHLNEAKEIHNSVITARDLLEIEIK